MKEVVVISGKGGTGKTTITASLAALWKDKVIADCDVDAADMHLLLDPTVQQKSDFYSGVEAVINGDRCTQCGKCLDVCRFHAISPEFVVDSLACEGCGVCPYFCPMDAISLVERHSGEWYVSDTRFGPMVHARLGIAEENSGKLVSLIRKKAKELAEQRGLDLILSDGSPGIGCPVISSITGASLVVVVTEPTISGVHDMDRVLGLAKHFQIQAAMIINKYDLNEEMTKTTEARAQEYDAPVLGRIPYDPVVTRAMVQGKTVVEFQDGAVAQAIEEIGQKLWQKVKA
jgi:MinD superfamily P-loop ATPase